MIETKRLTIRALDNNDYDGFFEFKPMKMLESILEV